MILLINKQVKTADGVIRGAYSYVDSNGIVQSVNYIADALEFRVGATNLPVHNVETPVNNIIEDSSNSLNTETPEPASKTEPMQSAVLSPKVRYSYLPYAASYGYTLPMAAPLVGVSGNSVDSANSQFHAQNDFGQYNYGFSNPTQTKQEVKTADGITRGSYSYVDANNLIQSKIRIFTRRVNGNKTENLTRRKLYGIFTAADGIVRGASQSLDSEEDIRQSITLQIILDLK